MRERLGVAAAVASAAIGGATIASTRIAMAMTDALTLSVVRFGGGFLILLSLALLKGARWPRREDWLGVFLLGVLGYVVFGLLFAWSMRYTTAAHGGIVFSTMPVWTMLIAAVAGVERLSARRTLGVLVAMVGVGVALLSGLATTPAGAWRGDLIMFAAVCCMSAYIVAARPFIGRSDALAFTTAGMGVGQVVLIVLALFYGDFASFTAFRPREWGAVAFITTAGGAVMFLLWVFAVGHTTPTATAVSVTANPISASIAGALLLSEPIGLNLLIGLVLVIAGISIAASRPRTSATAGAVARAAAVQEGPATSPPGGTR